jgi:hypothetical protein
MSSKWTKNSAVQQPPPVCKKPPAELPETTPPFDTQTMQCFASISKPGVTPPFFAQGIFDLPPEPPDTTWENGTSYKLDNVAVEIFSPPPYQLFNVTIAGFRGVTPMGTHTWSNVVPQSFSPFELPYLEHEELSPPAVYQVKISA